MMRPIAFLGKLAMGATAILIVAEATLTWLALRSLIKLDALHQNNQDTTPASVDVMARDIVATYDSALTIYVFVLLGAYVVNAVWVYRAVANAALIYPTPGRIGPGWAIGFYVVPILNFWKPYVAMRQTWNTSMRADRDMNAKAPKRLIVWWATWWISVVFGLLWGLFYAEGTWNGYMASITADFFNGIAAIPCSILFYQMIRDITQAQDSAGLETIFH